MPDTLAAIRDELAEFDLEELAPWVVQLQLEGITDPAQLLAELEFTAAFQTRFPGYRDPITGEVVMRIPERLEYEREVTSLFAGYGRDAPSRALIGNLVANRRKVNEVAEDLQAIDLLNRNHRMRRDFFAITGTQVTGEDLYALILGQAPDLNEAYRKAVREGVNAEAYTTRRLTYESQIRDVEAQTGGIEGTIGTLETRVGGIQARIDPISERIEGAVTRLKEQRGGRFVVTGADRKRLWEQVRGWRTRVGVLQGQQAEIRTTIDTTRTELETLQTRQGELETTLATFLSDSPDLTPDFALTGTGVPRSDILHNLLRARSVEEARFRSGGAPLVETEPRRRTF